MLDDLTLRSADILKIPAREILQTHGVMSILGGEIAYEAKKR